MTRDEIEALCAAWEAVDRNLTHDALVVVGVGQARIICNPAAHARRLAAALRALAQENEALRKERDYLRGLATLQSATDAARAGENTP